MENTEPTLSDVIDGEPLPFWVDGQQFFIRQPSTEEYDDALTIQTITRKRLLALPEFAEMKDIPCSDAERQTYEDMISASESALETVEDETVREAMVERITGLQRMLDKRSLADEIATDRAMLARDRYLCQRLLLGPDGKPLLHPKDKNFAEKWERVPLTVKDAARVHIWTAVAMVQNAPFSLDRLRR